MCQRLLCVNAPRGAGQQPMNELRVSSNLLGDTAVDVLGIVNTYRWRQNGQHLVDGIFKFIVLDKTVIILLTNVTDFSDDSN